MARDVASVRKVAVVLFNLGGPDKPRAVRPFLFNLFSDPAIISAPALIRYPLAALISFLRRRSAQANYARMGGGSPLLPETKAQASALGKRLAERAPGQLIESFIAMRYWKPFARVSAKDVAAFQPDDIVLAPLYPQYSTTTTGSSLKEWRRRYRGPGRVHILCCYPTLDRLVAAHAQTIREAWTAAGSPPGLRLLFSAHGLPEAVITRGDPYQSQIEATAAAVAGRVGDIFPDWCVCYQSRVGPMRWIGPFTPDAISQAASDGLGVIITPIAFVSEHIETLVELDHDYAQLAKSLGCPHYIRAPALGVNADFIEGLADMILAAIDDGPGLGPGSTFRCAANWKRCPVIEEAAVR